MANHRSAEKAYRQSIKKNTANTARKSKIKTFIKKVEEAITAKNEKAAKEALVKAQSEIMRGVSKNLIKKNTAARKISRLSARVKALKAA